MWSVVCFATDNTVAAVPKFWVRSAVCAWPKKYAQKLIEHRANPNQLEYDYFKCKILHSNIGSLLEARSLAQENSGLSSNDNFNINTKKRTKKPVTYKKNELLDVSSPPAHNLEGSDDGDDSYIIDNKTYTPVQLNDSDNDDNLFDDEVCSGIESGFKTPVNLPNKPKFEMASNKKFKLYNTYISTKNSASSSDVSVDEISINKNQLVSSQPELENDEAFKKNIRRSLTTLKYDVQNIHTRMDVLEALLEKIDGKLSGCSNIITSDKEDIIIIDNDDDLHKAEDKLTNDASYRSNMIRTLSRFSCNTLAETMRKIMQVLFSDSFLMNYSFIGFKGKNQFSTLQSCTVIFEAVRTIKKYSEVPNNEIEKPLKNWMAQAGQREKIKKLKMNNN
ncbi:unnamed protein product [Macrosiphum euphorbiae]|uniref:DUF4806 domain-containing protein n=1 Tax=Macrosiphum euphorbiae TaxID=13131 RepID=A0AAV0Y711_9HEMI|nr:unnamed protein product [Macrosiphum euphorbiae]